MAGDSGPRLSYYTEDSAIAFVHTGLRFIASVSVNHYLAHFATLLDKGVRITEGLL